MSKNNYFNYTNHRQHSYFIFYLMSFAMGKYKDEDPLLSDCAKELIRYILDMEESESVVVTEFDGQTVTVNNNKYIEIDLPSKKPKGKGIECYFVCYDPSADFYFMKYEWVHKTMYLPMKKLKEICGKYQSKNPIYLQYIQYLNEQMRMIQTTLQTPIEQWERDDYRRFNLHLVEDSVIDMSGGVFGIGMLCGSLDNPRFTHRITWRYLSSDGSGNRGIWKYIRAVSLETRFNTINISIEPSRTDSNEYIKKMESFVNGICPMPITFDLSNYKEKIQYAESIMDRLVAEFKL